MIKHLQECVVASFGSNITQSKQCKHLRDNVIAKTGKQISEATLRRFFGLLPTNSNPSRATLDVLACYAGFASWNDFCQQHRPTANANSHPSVDELWMQIAKVAATQGRSTSNRIRISSGIGFDIAADRHFVGERMTNFLRSNCGATAFVAPGGYGKSTSLAKWYVSQAQTLSPDIVLFVHVRQLEVYFQHDDSLPRALLQLLGFEVDSLFLDDYFISDRQTPPGRLLLIVDGIDETSLRGTRRAALHRGLVEFVERYTRTGFLKVVLALRSREWESLQHQIDDANCWFGVSPEHFSAQQANIPGLTFDEVQQVFDRSVNRRMANRILVYALPLDLCLTVSYPYYLQLFVRLCAQGDMAMLDDHIGLLLEFLSRQVYGSSLAEQKNDILTFIITRSGYSSQGVSKADLKEVYPVHLRQPDGYQLAYDEMLSFGIICEDVLDSPVSGYSSMVRIANLNLFWVLSAQCLLKSADKRASTFLQRVQRELADNEHKAEVFSALFKLAYLQERTDILTCFFELEEPLLDGIMATSVVSTVLPSNSKRYKQLLPKYMANAMARKMLVERSIDINHMSVSYLGLLRAYAEHANDDASAIFSRTMIGYGGILTLNSSIINSYVCCEGQASQLSPAAAGTWFVNSLIDSCIKSNSLTNIEPWMQHVRAHSENMSAIERFKLGEMLLMPLAAFAPAEAFAQIVNEMLEGIDSPTSHQRSAHIIALHYAKMLRREPISPENIHTLPQYYTWLSRQLSVPYIIMGESVRASLHMNFGNLEQATSCMRNGIELAAASGLKLFEASLLLKLAQFIALLGEKQWAQEIEQSGLRLWKASGLLFSPSL